MFPCVCGGLEELMPDIDELEDKLFALLCDWNRVSQFNHSNPKEAAKALAPEVLALIDKKELEARLIELNLFEQFLNKTGLNYPITSTDLYGFKMQRLKDLETRLDKLQEE